MRLGLFGKILIAYWLTLFGQGAVLMIMLGATPYADRSAVRVAPAFVRLLHRTLENNGYVTAEEERAQIDDSIRQQFTITPMTAGTPLPAEGDRMMRKGVAPDGRPYVVAFHRMSRRTLSAVPKFVFIGTLISGLIFSIGLALYISRPLRLLRNGFDRLAQGDLGVRLDSQFGSRHDELTDVARDFDRMAARLGQLVTARDRLLNDVSHELRSPLTRLRLSIGLARQDRSRVEASMDRVEREAEKLDELVDELLMLARAESGAVREGEEFFDPIGVVEAVVRGVDLEADAKGGKIELMVDDPDEHARPVSAGDARLFHRAVENVLRNAVRFSPEGKTVVVRVHILASPVRYEIAVLDEGPGMDPALIDTVLEPFVRAGQSGIGLGLSIADRALRAMGGTIRCKNRDGHGLCVEMELPASFLPA